MALRRIEESSELVVSVEEARAHLEVDDESPATTLKITRLIRAASRYFEEYTGRALLRQRWEAQFDAFPAGGGAIGLERPPVTAVDRVRFVDPDQFQQTLDPECYEFDAQSDIAWLVPAYDFVWPETLDKINAVAIEFTCGFASPGVVDENIVVGILLLIGHWFENREAVVTGTIASELPLGVDSCWAPYRVVRFA